MIIIRAERILEECRNHSQETVEFVGLGPDEVRSTAELVGWMWMVLQIKSQTFRNLLDLKKRRGKAPKKGQSDER